MGKVQSRGRKSRSGRYTKSSEKTQNKNGMTEDIMVVMERRRQGEDNSEKDETLRKEIRKT